MTDKPYNVGFLEEITNVHFGGGDWIAIFAFPSVHELVSTNSTLTAEFPSLEGGHPGVQLVTNNLHPAGFTANPHTLTAADMARTVNPSGARVYHSFGIWEREPAVLGDHGTPADYTLCWIQIPAELKKRGLPFIMKVTTAIVDPNLSGEPLGIGTFRERTIKKGYVAKLPAIVGPLGSIVFSMQFCEGVVHYVDAGMSPLDASQSFQIDPNTLDIIWL